MTEHVKTNDPVYITANFYHPVSGFSYAADATPRYLVYESGATLILQGDMTVRSTIVGSYWANFVASAANGFDAGYFYDVQVSGTVGGISGFAKVKDFVLDDVFSANIIQVSGQYVSIEDFQEETSSLTAAAVRIEMDANSLMFAAISGEVAGLNGYNVQTGLMSVSGVINTISNNVINIDSDIVAMSGSTLQANIIAVNGESVYTSGIVDVNIVQVSGQYVSMSDFGTSSLTAADVRTEMDANSLMFVAISGNIINIDSDIVAMSGSTLRANVVQIDSSGTAAQNMKTVFGTDFASNYSTTNDQWLCDATRFSGSTTAADNAEVVFATDFATNYSTTNDKWQVEADVIKVNGETVDTSGVIDVNIVQVSGVPVDINSFDFNTDIYFAHIKFVSDLTNNQDEFAVQWFKNDQPVSSGSLTNPRLSVYNTSNGSTLINGVAMSYASPNLGVVRYNTSMVLASGEPYLVETSGTIDSVMRTWKTIVGIDLI